MPDKEKNAATLPPPQDFTFHTVPGPLRRPASLQPFPSSSTKFSWGHHLKAKAKRLLFSPSRTTSFPKLDISPPTCSCRQEERRLADGIIRSEPRLSEEYRIHEKRDEQGRLIEQGPPWNEELGAMQRSGGRATWLCGFAGRRPARGRPNEGVDGDEEDGEGGGKRGEEGEKDFASDGATGGTSAPSAGFFVGSEGEEG